MNELQMTSESYARIVDSIRQASEDKGISRHQICWDTEMGPALVYNFFSGKRDIRLSSLLKILEATGLEIRIVEAGES